MGTIGETCNHFLANAAQLAKETGKMFFTTDRSFQQFGEGPAQLRGRSRQVMLSLFSGTMLGLVTLFAAYQYIMHPGTGNFFMLAVNGVGAAFLLREAAIQSAQRAIEKEKMGIEESEGETTYTLRDLFHEIGSNQVQAVNSVANCFVKSYEKAVSLVKSLGQSAPVASSEDRNEL